MRVRTLLFLLLASTTACDSTDYPARPDGGRDSGRDGSDGARDGGDGGDASDGGDGGMRDVFMPDLSEIEVGTWAELRPGEPTICSRGTEYAFYVYHGSSPNLVVNFVGGGACWNELTCSVADAIFQPTIDNVREAYEAGMATGITDMDNPENPVADYTQVVIPYCTGDVHWGNKVTTYGAGGTAEVTINHKGAVNTRTVLDWVYENVTMPDKVLTTGCSAGGYGSSMWAAHLMNHYDDAHHVQFSDSAAGVITQTFFMDSFPSWNATEAFPTFIEGFDADEIDELSDGYIAFANHFPDATFSQYNTIFDENQTFYYTAMGGEGEEVEWSRQMRASIAEISTGAPTNFRFYMAPGERHCIIVFPEFYTVESNGVKLTDWLGDLLEGGDRPDSVMCTDCETPP